MHQEQSFSYTDRIVSFVDLLGFAECVNRSVTDAASMTAIRQFLDTSGTFQQIVKNFLTHKNNKLVEVSYFSDTFVISVSAENLIYLVRETGHLCRHMLLSGWPCRGAIVAGALSHNEEAVIGPALVEAYRLEQAVALYPRVVLNDQALAHWHTETAAGSETESSSPIVKQDKDGLHFLDLFDPAWNQFSDPYNLPKWKPLSDFSSAAQMIIETGLTQYSKDPRVLQKYEWLRSEWRRHT